MKKKRVSFINIGFSSIVMVFITLCLVTFAALSILTANSDYQLSKKMAEKTSVYYKADLCAKEAAAFVETALYKLYTASDDEETFYSALTCELLSEDISDEITNFMLTKADEHMEVSYEVPFSGVQTLYVTLSIHYPETETDTLLDITRWQTKTSNEPDESENTLHLYGND